MSASPDTGSSLPERAELAAALSLVSAEAQRFHAALDERRVRSPRAETALRAFEGGLPERGVGASAALRELIEHGSDALVASAGPRFFHFVVGGQTPAALGADWLASAFDQLSAAWVSSPLAVTLERLGLRWLRELFELPSEWGGVLTTGAMMANFTGLTAARQWCGERAGVDVAEQGLHALEPIEVLTSGYVHTCSRKALALLGIGRQGLRCFARDAVGRLDLEALEAALAARRGKPTIVIANAGEVNAGDFDPLERMAELAQRHGAWLHVDGAFGLFARLGAASAQLTAGLERADSLASDAHKWLNVPYDCGFCFVRDEGLLERSFRQSAEYLPEARDARPNLMNLGPESSRRARSFAVWATLRAYGRAGYRELVEGHLRLAQHLARRVDESAELERLAEVPLNIVCFRYDPGGLAEAELERINQRIGEEILDDGRVYVGTTQYGGKLALRPAIVNWRTREADVDLLVEVVRELGDRARPSS